MMIICYPSCPFKKKSAYKSIGLDVDVPAEELAGEWTE